MLLKGFQPKYDIIDFISIVMKYGSKLEMVYELNFKYTHEGT